MSSGIITRGTLVLVLVVLLFLIVEVGIKRRNRLVVKENGTNL